jgi:hypothetical protein
MTFLPESIVEVEDGLWAGSTQNGAIVISTMLTDFGRVEKSFFFYTLDESVSLFKEFITEGKYKNV